MRATAVLQTDGTPLGTVTPDFQGLSFESGSLPSGDFDTVGNLPKLLENLGPGGVLRLGGNSVDKPQYVAVGGDQLTALARLAQAVGWKIIYSENEGQFNAARVTADTAAATKALGSSLLGIACGNEPDRWTDLGYRPGNWGPKDELGDAAACLAAVRSASPEVPFVGNDDADSMTYFHDYVPWAKGKAAMITRHFYPLTNCAGKPHGTSESLVSAQVAQNEVKNLDTYAALARNADLPIRMDETNSASCSGIPGVSDSDATALWAADYLMMLAEHGYVGANFHTGLTGGNCTGYTPLCQVGDHQYRAQPVYYGLLFAHLLDTGQVLPVKVSAGDQLAAHAVKSPDGSTRTMLLNRGSSPLTVTAQLGPSIGNTASGWRLSMPSLTATSGVTIGGATVAPDGSFTPGTAEKFSCTRGTCMVTLPAYSGLVLTGSTATS